MPTVGVAGGLWSGGLSVGLSGDQRPDEALSLVFTSGPLGKPLEVLGRPRAILHVSSSADVAAFIVKLCDVAPDGAVALVTRGILNGTRRESLAGPRPMVPGKVHELTIDLDATGWIFEPGHRIRLAISGSDFPNIWPTPLPAVNRVSLGGLSPSRLNLPLALSHAPEASRPVFLPPPPPQPTAEAHAEGPAWEVRHDVMAGTTSVQIEQNRTLRLPDGTEIAERLRMRSTASQNDPAHAVGEGETQVRRVQRGRAVEAIAVGTLRSSPHELYLGVNLEVLLDGRPHFHRRWVASFPRVLL